jgi:tetratricopeptide (TPR) repeat protein
MKTTWYKASGLINRSVKGLMVVAVLCLANTAGTAHAAVKASRGQITLPTYPWAAVKHPYFRGTDKVNIYPYPMLDFISREKTNRTYQTVILENEYLRLTFLPELGGRIHEVIDKTTGQPMFYVNHVIKPGLIGQCGAWISGGVEWNTGPQGHTVSCVQPVDVVILPPEKNGSRSVAIGETERIYHTKWTVVVTLRPGRSFIEERIRIYNPAETVRPYYFWNCTAVPNTPGFRFIYPMTLGTDHSAEKFFHWPIDNGKDLSRGASYQDASSIFAWYCDQDFFGSYNDDLDRGVVAYANHHQLPGKKAWTWGHGSYGTMHQMDLTDDDGPYNEVQTGPLLTQGEVGRLDPCEAVEWQEWWYPIHGIGGFTFANQNVAVNAAVDGGQLKLRILGTGTWKSVEAKTVKAGRQLASARCNVTAQKPTELALDLAGKQEPFEVVLTAHKAVLTRFRIPLDLPVRKPPEMKPVPLTAAEFVQAGWQDFLFARFPEAQAQFRRALESDPKCVEAYTGLAYLNLDRDPAASAKAARSALEVDPDCGQARFALAVAECRIGDEKAALEDAWKASLDPARAVAGRAVVAKLLIRRRDRDGAIRALSASGPWQSDPTCRNRLALALVREGKTQPAAQLAESNLNADPLDYFAQSVLWLADKTTQTDKLRHLLWGRAQPVMELAAEYAALHDADQACRILRDFYAAIIYQGPAQNPIPLYWVASTGDRMSPPGSTDGFLRRARLQSPERVFPCEPEAMTPLRWALAQDPNDGNAALYLGHLLFYLGRHAEGREMWGKAAELGAAPVIACRALGMASFTLDNDPDTAIKYLTQAHKADPTDAIVARDLARLLFTLADQTESADRKRELTVRARDTLKAAFDAGKGRSDFVALLARAQNRLGDFAATANLLDSARITIWEGAREAHDLFEEAHLALGEAHLKAGHATEALTEFNRALEYPSNLATGRMENTREAHIHYLRGNALAALGQKTAAIQAWQKAADEPASQDKKKEASRRLAREAIAETSPPQ